MMGSGMLEMVSRAGNLLAFHDQELVNQVRGGASQVGSAIEPALWVPIGLMVGGFVALLAWALSRGQFRDTEAPKHRMLELEEKGGVEIHGRR